MPSRSSTTPGSTPSSTFQGVVRSSMASLPLRHGLAAGLALAVLATPSVNAEPTSGISLDYRLYIGGLHALSMTTRLSGFDEPDHYAMAVTARTDGFVARIIDASYVAKAHGTMASGIAMPSRFRGTASDEDEGERSVTLTWSDGVPEVIFDPVHEAPDAPLADEIIDGTVDPSSAVLTIMQTVATNDTCEARIRVFDGKRRYDMVSSHGGDWLLRKTDHNAYGGPATECIVTIERLAGFRKRRLAKRYPSEFSIYLGRLREDLLPVPVRLHANNLFGAVRVHLVAWREEHAGP